MWLFLSLKFVFLLLSSVLVVDADSHFKKLAIIFLDLKAQNQKNPVSAVEGLPEADPLSRS